MPGRIVGATEDAEGRRGLRPDASDARAAHPPRARRHRTSARTRRSWRCAATVYLRCSATEGLRELAARICRPSAEYAADGPRPHRRCASCTSTRPFFQRVRRRAAAATRDRRQRPSCRGAACWPGLRCGVLRRGLENCLLVAVTEKHTRARVDALRRRRGQPRDWRRKRASSPRETRPEPTVFEQRQPGPPRLRLPAARRARDDLERAARRATGAARDAAELPELTELESCATSRAVADELIASTGRFYPLGSCTMKYNPKVNEDVARAARASRASIRCSRRRRAARARSRCMYELSSGIWPRSPAWTRSPCSPLAGPRAS